MKKCILYLLLFAFIVAFTAAPAPAQSDDPTKPFKDSTNSTWKNNERNFTESQSLTIDNCRMTVNQKGDHGSRVYNVKAVIPIKKLNPEKIFAIKTVANEMVYALEITCLNGEKAIEYATFIDGKQDGAAITTATFIIYSHLPKGSDKDVIVGSLKKLLASCSK